MGRDLVQFLQANRKRYLFLNLLIYGSLLLNLVTRGGTGRPISAEQTLDLVSSHSFLIWPPVALMATKNMGLIGFALALGNLAIGTVVILLTGLFPRSFWLALLLFLAASFSAPGSSSGATWINSLRWAFILLEQQAYVLAFFLARQAGKTGLWIPIRYDSKGMRNLRLMVSLYLMIAALFLLSGLLEAYVVIR
ncbi:MAG: hypothetical protein ACE5NP_05110 [Anaerolineae bacterium]